MSLFLRHTSQKKIPQLTKNILPAQQLRTRYSLLAFTLLEALVTMTLIVGMMSLALPGWRAFEQRMTRRTAMSLLLRGCEQARVTAITQRADTTILLQHRSTMMRDRFRIVQQDDDENIRPVTSWIELPTGVQFLMTPQTIMSEPAPVALIEKLQQLSPQEQVPASDIIGCLQWNAQGSIIYSPQKNIPLLLDLSTTSGKTIDQISFTRLTGRATRR